MANRSSNSSQSGSRSPSTASSNVSPPSNTIPLMVPEDTSPNNSARNTPNRNPVDLPRSQSANKGGCWTCRLRRKKCDEQREGESCHTCKRLTIECLGWGSKRPDWMRDKQAVETYKANIKAQLTSKGLIRGQPRSLTHGTGGSVQSHTRRQPYTRSSAPEMASSSSQGLDSEYTYPSYLEPPHPHRHSMMPALPGNSTTNFHHLPAASFSDSNIPGIDLPNFFTYSPQPLTPVTSTLPLGTEPFIDFGLPAAENSEIGFQVRPPSPTHTLPTLSGQNSIQGDHVIYYFEHVRKVQYMFAGNTFTNATYSLIVQEPRGAVTNAVCALASLHFSRVRVAQGLEAPDPKPEHSNATYFHNEAFFQLGTAKQLHGSYSESDAIAALHLVSYSQLSGGATDWQRVFGVACEWLTQSRIHEVENPVVTLRSMSPTGQLIVKATIWLDVISSVTLMHTPRFHGLCSRLLGNHGPYWVAGNSLRMDSLIGWPDDSLLGVAEVSVLASWKLTEQRSGSLSFRDLIRRGDAIEQKLRRRHPDAGLQGDRDQAPLHPSLMQTSSIAEMGLVQFPSDEMRRLVAEIFRESVILYLHTILSNSNPGVPEIAEAVEVIAQLFNQLPPSPLDRALIFPICFAGSLTDSPSRRDQFKRRLLHLDDCIGNVTQCRQVIEAVWQKRDSGAGAVDIREIIQEHGMSLLLV